MYEPKGETQHVTSRRKNRLRPLHGDDDELFPPSATKKLHIDKDYTGTDPLARRQLQLDGLHRVTKTDHPKISVTPRKSEDVVSKLLAAHVKTKTKINSANCFEKQTVLDLMSTENIREESMADMALVLNSAVEVYGFRVDRCYMHAQDTRGQVASTMDKSSTNPLLDPNKETPRKRRRDDIKQNLGDWKARIDEEIERELSDEREESDEELEKRHIPEEDPETFLDDIPSNMDEMDNFLDSLLSQRRNLNKKLYSHNTHLVEENDELLDRSNKELSSNEFYQKAVSRYGEGNSCALLMYNAKVSSESQAYLVHSRIVNNPVRIPGKLSAEYLKNVKAAIANALSDRPVSLENDCLPKIGDVLHESDDDESGEEQESTDVNSTNDGFTPIKQKNPFSRAKDFRKSIIFRGKNVFIDRLWIADDSVSLNPSDSFGTFDTNEFARILKLRHQEDFQAEKGRLAPEVDLNYADVKERSIFMLNAGLDDEVKELDNLWNVQLVQRNVTQVDTEDMIRRVEENDGTPDEIIAMKKRILAPGNYIFFIEGEAKTIGSHPVDCWQSDSDDALNLFGTEIFDDAFDDDGFDDPYDAPPAMEPLPDEFLELPNEQQAEKIADQVKVIMERNLTPVKEENDRIIPVDDIADVPVNPEQAANDLDEAVRNIGKDDNAHWKGNKAVDAEKDAKKMKKRLPEEKPSSVENYWAASNPDMRREALERFTLRVNRNVEKPEGQIFMARPPIRTPYAVYDFEQLNKFGCLNGKVTYPNCSWANAPNKDELIARGVEFMNTSLLDDEGKDILGIEYFRALRGIQLMVEEERKRKQVNLESDHEAATDVEADDDFRNADHDSQNDIQPFEDDLDGAESFHTADGNPWSPDPQLATHQLWPTKKSKVQEIRDLQAADDIEDEGEVAQGLEGNAPIIIKNTSIDQSKVKGYLKNILTNKMLDRKCMKTVTEAAKDRDYLDHTFQAVRNMTINNDLSVMNGSFDFKDTGIDPLEVSRCVFTSTDELSQPSAYKHKDGTSQEALQNAVVLSDFDVEGEHSLASMMACLPYRAQKNSEKNMHVALLFSVALQMCNENTLHCVQDRNFEEEGWMGDFILRNGTGGTQPSTSFFNQNRPPRAPRDRPEVILEDDEEMEETA